MRKLFTVLAAAGIALLGVSAANAGQLKLATFSTVVDGISITKTTQTVTGSDMDAGTPATMDAGSAFATAFSIAIPSASPVYPTLSNVIVQLGANGSISATKGGAINVGAPLTGNVAVQGLSIGTLENIPLNVGVAGTQTGSVLGGAIVLTIIANPWTLGQAVASGLTANGSPVPNVTTTGRYSAYPGATIGTVKLVTTSKVIVRGLETSTQATVSTLSLTYIPEPGTLLLLGAGIVGLSALGRKKRA